MKHELILKLGLLLSFALSILEMGATPTNPIIKPDTIPDDWRSIPVWKLGTVRMSYVDDAYTQPIPIQDDKLFTHYILAFAEINENCDGITLRPSYALSQLMDLKIKNPELKKIICVSSGLKHLSGIGLSCVEDMDVSGSSISQDELKQLEQLRYLKCDYMGWNKGDFSSNLELEKLSCVGNNMSEIIVKDNKKLHLLNCRENCLVSVNLSNNNELTELICDRNQIAKIDLKALTRLNRLSISQNLLTSLMLDNNGELNYLDCSDNMLAGLDVSHCPNLSNLNVTGNPGKDRKFSLLMGYNPSLRISSDSWPYKSWYVTIEKTGM